MNKHVSGAEREVASSAQESLAPEFDAATWGAEEAVKAMVAYQVEWLRFLARRTYCNLEFMRHLPHCHAWQDVTELQQAWFKGLVADYGEEVGRIAGTSLQLATSDFMPLQPLLYRETARHRGDNGRGV